MEKLVRVNIKGMINARITDLNPFQEDIKILTDENYERFKAEILEDGFSFSPHVFVDADGKLWILDGHQRYSCLTRMIAEGYSVPIIPCMEVEADDLEHARRLVLAAASQYGTFKAGKVMDFLGKAGLQPVQAATRFVLPAVKLERFTGVNAHNRKIGEGAKEYSAEEFSSFDHKCPKCGFEFNDDAAE